MHLWLKQHALVPVIAKLTGHECSIWWNGQLKETKLQNKMLIEKRKAVRIRKTLLLLLLLLLLLILLQVLVVK